MSQPLSLKLIGKAWCYILPAAAYFATPVRAETVRIDLLQINDIYEITPVSGGSQGGLARVATIRQQLLQQNPNTYTVLAGDALSPSALGTARVNGQPLAGQQMVAVLNAVGLDYATFGNHEFDLPQNLFLERLKESRFTWFSGNVFDRQKRPFPNVPQSVIFNVKGERGATVRVGLIGVTLNSNKADYVTYTDPMVAVKEQVKALAGKADILIGVTHLPIEKDRELVETVPELNLILGGHEHENIQQWRGKHFVPIFKADANVRTVYIHRLNYDTVTRHLKIESRLQPITNAIPEDPQTAQVVRQWVETGFQAFRASGFNPEEVIGETDISLDGLEESVRNRSTTLTELIAKAVLAEFQEADLAIFNSGSIRIDDILPPGKITQYDVIRMLPFGGKVVAVAMKGDLLQRVLDRGQTNRGTGGYLQMAQVDRDRTNGWLIRGKLLDPNQTYKVAITDFLISGREQGLDFLNLQQAGIELIAEKRDIRLAVIDQIKNQRKRQALLGSWTSPLQTGFNSWESIFSPFNFPQSKVGSPHPTHQRS